MTELKHNLETLQSYIEDLPIRATDEYCVTVEYGRDFIEELRQDSRKLIPKAEVLGEDKNCEEG